MAATNNANGTKSLLNMVDILEGVQLEHKELIKEKLSELTKKTDIFLANKNLLNLRTWYETKNPNYKKLSELPDLRIPEHEYTALYMINTILLLLSSGRFPKKKITNLSSNEALYGSNSFQLANSNITKNPERQQNAKTLLIRLIDYINTGYIYQKFFNIVISYILFYSTGRIELNEEDRKNLSRYLTLYDTFFIIYPTMSQINFTKVVLFMNAPVINFRCSNQRYKIHGNYNSPIIDMNHDISHCNLTHGIHLINYKGRESTYTYYHPFNMSSVPAISNYITVLNNINMIINQLYPYISYDYKIINDFIKIPLQQEQSITDKIKEEISKFIFSWLLFTYFHENAIYNFRYKKIISKIYEKNDRSVNGIIIELINNSNNIIKDVKELVEEFQDYKKLFFIASGAKSLEEFDNVFLNDILNADIDFAGNIIKFGLSILPEDLKFLPQVSTGGFIKNKKTSSKHKIFYKMKINKQNTKKKA
jgi:hypothetical protein